MTDTHQWIAHYSDGSRLNEYDEAGQSHGFAEVDQSRLVALEFVPVAEGRGVCVRLGKDARPILFRRRQIHFNIESLEQQPGATIACLGFQKTINGRNTKAVLALYEDGSVLLVDDTEVL